MINSNSPSSIDLIYTLNGCPSPVETSIITVTPLPDVTFFSNVQSGCSPLDILLTANYNSSTADYTWNIDNTYTHSGNPVQSTLQVGNYYDITLSVTDNGCFNTTSIQDYIYVEDTPQAYFSSSSNSFTELSEEIIFTNSSIGANSYIWDFGDGSSSTLSDPIHSYANTITGYTISLYAFSPLGCQDSISINIPYEDGLVYYIPNSFTPDGDLCNQVFSPVFTSGFDPSQFSMKIFNRWGEIVFETQNSKIGWDGSYGKDGLAVPQGVYTYHIMYKIPAIDDRRVIVGHVHLIK